MKQHRLHMMSVAALAALGTAGSALAGGIVTTGGTTQVSTPGNTPIVNIAGANAAGISRNTFSNFDVDRNGVVFNNLTAAGVSQLAGQLAANANLNGTAAKVIVADVNSAQASQLNGALEVAGAPAHLMIANAAGISVNGATTINAPVLTLAAANFNPTAASPLGVMVDTNRATPATIEINGAGLDVGAGQLNLLSRATIVNAGVKGWSINSQNGTQFDGDADGNFTGKLTSNAAGAKPAVALDVSELGGMYANKIVLEGSEHGLGVNNAGVIASGRGGLAVQMYGADLAMTGAGMFGSDGVSTVVRSAEMFATPDELRPVQYRGLDEARIFALKKQEALAAAEKANAYSHYSPADAERWDDSRKIALVNDVASRADKMRSEMPVFVPERAAETAAREAEQRAQADGLAAREAQMEIARQAWEAQQLAQQQADAQRRAAERAALDAQIARERKAADEAQAARQAQAEADAQRQAAAKAAYDATVLTQQASYAPQAEPATVRVRYVY
ncbi:filamentous hemagglutinin N-terminal domain-containing protein [Paraburkholderia bryophila]|uniref:Filamentous hemagglutinin n=1 Tax=Paraburkholderia bryophila TaxID=420952 RepID=A0A329CUE1_9BURK|nr:filamentous hemagglutinin N-terminal domain-containing protein [Paraburkholderia bryophila]RAS37767.1 filamentous hemagglutinin [Paraburkholderia bryophila]